MKKGLIATALLVVAAPLTALNALNARAATPDTQLLSTYQPVMILDSQEPFGPASVQSFIVDSQLEQLVSGDPATGNWQVVRTNAGPGNLPGPGVGTWRLNEVPCSPAMPLGGLTCYQQAWNEGHGASVVYGRVDHVGDSTVLQYWYFYYDDVYSYSHLANGWIWQAHEGDWEVVNVVLGPDLQPTEVGYSQHCSGEVHDWSSPSVEKMGTHPVVYVALGSHANYFSAGLHTLRTACVPAQALAVLQAYGLAMPQDRANGSGTVAGPPQTGDVLTTIHPANDEAQRWLTFPGFWGESQYFHFAIPGLPIPPPLPPSGTAPLGTSPVGPMYHSIWTDPLAALALWAQGEPA